MLKPAINSSDFSVPIKVLETSDRKFVYDCGVNQIFEIDDKSARILDDYARCIASGLPVTANADADFGPEEVKETIDFFRKTRSGRKSGQPYHLQYEHSSDLKIIPRTLEFVITGQCNLSCRYCATRERYASPDGAGGIMSEETALKAVGLLRRFYDNGPLLVKFFGGEPLLGIKVIHKVMSKLSEFGIDSENMIATNGLFLDEETIDFLAEHRFLTYLSLDGPAAVHDRFRKDKHGRGTYNKVVEKLQLIQARQPEYFKEYVVFNMVVTPEHVGNYVDNVNHLLGLGVAHDQIRPTDTAPTDEACTHYNPSQIKDVRHEKSRFRKKIMNSIVSNNQSDDSSCHETYCQFKPQMTELNAKTNLLPPQSNDTVTLTDCQRYGWNIITILPDGKISACIEFSRREEFNFGDLNADELYLEKLKAFREKFRKSVMEGRCASCWAIRFCSYTGCYKIFADNLGEPGWQKHKVCNAIRDDLQDRLEDYLRLKTLTSEI
jgi:uncharacterized protein